MKLTILLSMSILSLFGCCKTASEYPTDTIKTKNGTEIKISFFAHSSLSIELDGRHIYIDPVIASANYPTLPKADLVLITHFHGDHLDSTAITTIAKPTTIIVADSTSSSIFGSANSIISMLPAEKTTPIEDLDLQIEAVAAYNTHPDRQMFHPRDRKDCGYIITIGGSRIYIAGDSEPTPEMLALADIDIAFLPVNQPYTMTVDQAIETIKTLRPTIFYPYHTGQVEEKTDLVRLANELADVTEVRIRPME